MRQNEISQIDKQELVRLMIKNINLDRKIVAAQILTIINTGTTDKDALTEIIKNNHINRQETIQIFINKYNELSSEQLQKISDVLNQ